MDRLVRRASSVLGCPLDSVEVVGNRRMMAKLSSLLNNTSHPLQDTLTALGSSFSERLLHPRCVKESSSEGFFMLILAPPVVKDGTSMKLTTVPPATNQITSNSIKWLHCSSTAHGFKLLNTTENNPQNNERAQTAEIAGPPFFTYLPNTLETAPKRITVSLHWLRIKSGSLPHYHVEEKKNQFSRMEPQWFSLRGKHVFRQPQTRQMMIVNGEVNGTRGSTEREHLVDRRSRRVGSEQSLTHPDSRINPIVHASPPQAADPPAARRPRAEHGFLPTAVTRETTQDTRWHIVSFIPKLSDNRKVVTYNV
ncbi:hypothetical protein L3Q82_005617 [Scortum barcoo]|uniref:Uncharacterized protein n=1 Tax=Scortum barcoo TaxID=214431 RepID=A0ACB8V6Y8_9TELE|nr:hypothetical protein L3Q82_005617 [Scortum barcoo]